MRPTSSATSTALAALALAAVLTGCSSGSSDSADPTASASRSAASPSASASASSPASPSATATALSTPQAQASALVDGLAQAGALSADQRRQVQDQLATALARPSTQSQLEQVCSVLKTGLVSDSQVASQLGKQLSGNGVDLTQAQARALVTTLRTDVCTG